MKSDRKSDQTNDDRRKAKNAFESLASVPSDIYAEVLEKDQNSGFPLLLSEKDSQIAISHAIKQAMEAKKDITLYILSETAQLPIESVQDFMDGNASISDSQPLTQLSNALRSLGATLEVPLECL